MWPRLNSPTPSRAPTAIDADRNPKLRQALDRCRPPDRQRSLRCAAALIIASCASVSLTRMIQPFLSSWRSGRSGPLARTSPGSVNADGAVRSSAHRRAILHRHQCFLSDGKPVLPTQAAALVNGRISRERWTAKGERASSPTPGDLWYFEQTTRNQSRQLHCPSIPIEPNRSLFGIAA